jgi:hypothetical protein
MGRMGVAECHRGIVLRGVVRTPQMTCLRYYISLVNLPLMRSVYGVLSYMRVVHIHTSPSWPASLRAPSWRETNGTKRWHYQLGIIARVIAACYLRMYFSNQRKKYKLL